jgi:hypothetical protein
VYEYYTGDKNAKWLRVQSLPLPNQFRVGIDYYALMSISLQLPQELLGEIEWELMDGRVFYFEVKDGNIINLREMAPTDLSHYDYNSFWDTVTDLYGSVRCKPEYFKRKLGGRSQ